MSGARHAGLSATATIVRATGASTGTSPSSRAAGWSARRSSSTSRSRPTRSPSRSPRSWSPPTPELDLTDRRPGPSPITSASPPREGRPDVSVGASMCPGARPAGRPCHHRPRWPAPLAAPIAQPDVIVIGGGIVGVSCAAHLAASGRRVVGCSNDREIAAGASGRNSGVVQHPFDPVLVELHLETLALYRALETAGVGDSRCRAEPVRAADGHATIDGRRATAGRHLGPKRIPVCRPTFLGPGEVRAVEPTLATGRGGLPSGDRLSGRAGRRDPRVRRVGHTPRRRHPRRARPRGPGSDRAGSPAWSWRMGVVWRPRTWSSRRVPGRRPSSTRAGPGDRSARRGAWSSASRWSDPRCTSSRRPRSRSNPGTNQASRAAPRAHPSAWSPRPPQALSDRPSWTRSRIPAAFVPVDPGPWRRVRSGHRIGHGSVRTASAPARRASMGGRSLGRVAGLDGLWIAAGHGPWGISTGPASGRLLADLLDGRVSGPPPMLDPDRFAPPPLA